MDKLLQLLNTEYGFDLKEISGTTTLSELSGINVAFDSLTAIQFIIDAEDRFGFEIPPGVNPKSINDILEYMGEA